MEFSKKKEKSMPAFSNGTLCAHCRRPLPEVAFLVKKHSLSKRLEGKFICPSCKAVIFAEIEGGRGKRNIHNIDFHTAEAVQSSGNESAMPALPERELLYA